VAGQRDEEKGAQGCQVDWQQAVVAGSEVLHPFHAGGLPQAAVQGCGRGAWGSGGTMMSWKSERDVFCQRIIGS
jgi:hypothetical protein